METLFRNIMVLKKESKNLLRISFVVITLLFSRCVKNKKHKVLEDKSTNNHSVSYDTSIQRQLNESEIQLLDKYYSNLIELNPKELLSYKSLITREVIQTQNDEMTQKFIHFFEKDTIIIEYLCENYCGEKYYINGKNVENVLIGDESINDIPLSMDYRLSDVYTDKKNSFYLLLTRGDGWTGKMMKNSIVQLFDKKRGKVYTGIIYPR